jgi:hypothetical protein
METVGEYVETAGRSTSRLVGGDVGDFEYQLVVMSDMVRESGRRLAEDWSETSPETEICPENWSEFNGRR